MIILVLRLCLRYCILYTAKREGSASASANHEATARGADAASLQWAKPASGVADGRGGGGYPRSIPWPVDDTSPIADGLRTTPRAISCNGEEGEEEKG